MPSSRRQIVAISASYAPIDCKMRLGRAQPVRQIAEPRRTAAGRPHPRHLPPVRRAAAPDRPTRLPPAAARGWWRGIAASRPARNTASAKAAAAPITCSQVSSTSSSTAAGERLRDALRRDCAAAKIEPDRRGNGDGHEAGIGDRRKLGQPHTVGKLRQEPARRGESEPRFADAAGAGQGNEPVC